jgi:hypothetical protein
MNKEYFINKLKSIRPSVFLTNDYSLLPETFLAFTKIPIICKFHGIFYQQTSCHLNGNGCQECGKQKCADNRATSTEEFILKSKQMFNDKFSYDRTFYTRQDSDLTITCSVHGDISISPRHHFRLPEGCLECNFEIPRNIRKEKYIKKAKEIHNDKYDYSKVVYKNADSPVEIICPTHGSFWQGLYSHTAKKCNCPKCMDDKNGFSQEEFIRKSKLKHNDKYDYSKVVYETNVDMVTITCLTHGDFVQRAASHLKGYGCRKCHVDSVRKTTEEFVRKAKGIHGAKYDYSKVVYEACNQKVEIVCPAHGSFWQEPQRHISASAGCRGCRNSKGEIAVKQVLDKFNINYISEFRLFPFRHRSDFYLPELNIHIEFNGLQHYKPVDMFGGEKAYLKVKENDAFKRQLIKSRNEFLIVLTYLHLTNDSVEKELIYRLKQVYKYWFVVNGKIQVFKSILAVYETFKLSKSIAVKDIEKELMKTNKNIKCLF